MAIKLTKHTKGLDFTPLIKKTVHESNQISKQHTSAAHFNTHNLVRKGELIPSLHSQRQMFAKREGQVTLQ